MSLLTVSGVAIACSVGLFPADVCTVLGPSVPAHPLLVVDAAVCIQPDDHVFRAVRVRRVFGGEHRELARRSGGCRLRCRGGGEGRSRDKDEREQRSGQETT